MHGLAKGKSVWYAENAGEPRDFGQPVGYSFGSQVNAKPKKPKKRPDVRGRAFFNRFLQLRDYVLWAPKEYLRRCFQ